VSPPISYHPGASREVREAAEYYELVRDGLGREFLDALESTIDQIRRYPEAAPIVEGAVRKALFPHRFPYSVLYPVRPSAIRILAIAHHRRRPLYWQRRQ
jgi:plasmid stabilization system protein ParE